MTPRLHHLRYFVKVADAGQFTRAARELNVAQPALSRAIAAFESKAGVVVFERSVRGVTLTPAGEALLEKARAVLAAKRDLDSFARSHAHAQRWELRVGFVGIPPFAKARELLTSFEREHADVELVFRELGPPRCPLAEWLSEVDAALLFSVPANGNVDVQRVREEPRSVLMSARHRLADRKELAVADVLDERFVGVHPSVDRAWAGFWRLDDHRRSPTVNVTRDEPLSVWELATLVASRDALTTAPATSAELLAGVVDGIVAIRLSDANPAVLSLAWQKTTPNALVAALADVARSSPRMRTQ